VEDQVRVSPSISVIAFMLGVSLILVGLLLVIMGAMSIPGDATEAEAGGLVMIGPHTDIFPRQAQPPHNPSNTRSNDPRIPAANIVSSEIGEGSAGWRGMSIIDGQSIWALGSGGSTRRAGRSNLN
jgi:uncharacterized membrane protein